MLRPTTHFEQVPLEVVKKIVEEQVRKKQVLGTDRQAKKQKSIPKLIRASPVDGGAA